MGYIWLRHVTEGEWFVLHMAAPCYEKVDSGVVGSGFFDVLLDFCVLMY